MASVDAEMDGMGGDATMEHAGKGMEHVAAEEAGAPTLASLAMAYQTAASHAATPPATPPTLASAPLTPPTEATAAAGAAADDEALAAEALPPVKPLDEPWTPFEHDAIREAVIEHGECDWATVVAVMRRHGRDSDSCTRHWHRANPLIKGAWSKQEDDLLIGLVDRLGAKNWSTVAAHVPGRNAKQCRERWVNNLDPTVNKGPWTPEEDQALIRAQREMGNKWSEIAKRIEGRPDNAVKNRWYCMVNRNQYSRPPLAPSTPAAGSAPAGSLVSGLAPSTAAVGAPLMADFGLSTGGASAAASAGAGAGSAEAPFGVTVGLPKSRAQHRRSRSAPDQLTFVLDGMQPDLSPRPEAEMAAGASSAAAIIKADYRWSFAPSASGGSPGASVPDLPTPSVALPGVPAEVPAEDHLYALAYAQARATMRTGGRGGHDAAAAGAAAAQAAAAAAAATGLDGSVPVGSFVARAANVAAASGAASVQFVEDYLEALRNPAVADGRGAGAGVDASAPIAASLVSPPFAGLGASDSPISRSAPSGGGMWGAMAGVVEAGATGASPSAPGAEPPSPLGLGADLRSRASTGGSVVDCEMVGAELFPPIDGTMPGALDVSLDDGPGDVSAGDYVMHKDDTGGQRELDYFNTFRERGPSGGNADLFFGEPES